ncbi:MAG: CvpA family protein [bacterium]|nr:CvpA family protein [bacterium]
MHWFDVSVGIVLLIGSVWSFYRGLIHEIIAIFGMIAAFMLSIQGYPYVAVFLQAMITQEWLRQTLGFGLIFLLVTVFYMVLARLLHRLVKVVGLSLPNRMLGGLFGFAKVGVMLAALLLVTAQIFPAFATTLGSESRLAPVLFRVASTLSALLPAQAADEFQQIYDRVRRKLPDLAPALAPLTTSESPSEQRHKQPQEAEGISASDAQALERIIQDSFRKP